MYGAILGDIIGSPYEFNRGDKTKDFPLFSARSHFTDDSVMSIAVADALLRADDLEEKSLKRILADSLRAWGLKYPHAGYGGRFCRWLIGNIQGPYNSYGNGSAMRVSAVGWLFDDMVTTRRVARYTAEITHNHSEGVKGAESIAAAIFLSQRGYSKDDIMEYITREFSYDLTASCDEIRRKNVHDESCQKTVPAALRAFYEGENFEDVIRTAVSLGGDTDTLACIAGSVAEAFYGVPDALRDECFARISGEMREVLERFDRLRERRTQSDDNNDNVVIEYAIKQLKKRNNSWAEAYFDESMVFRMAEKGKLLVPMLLDEIDRLEISMAALGGPDGRKWNIAFTSSDEQMKGREYTTFLVNIEDVLQAALTSEVDGLIINPWSNTYFLNKRDIKRILKLWHGYKQ